MPVLRGNPLSAVHAPGHPFADRAQDRHRTGSAASLGRGGALCYPPSMPEPAKPLLSFDSAESFLSWEAEQTERHEFVNGYAYAMAGSSPRHSRIAMNCTAALLASLSRECAPFESGQRIATVGGTRYRYADASVVCGAGIFQGSTLLNPTVIIEVLSQSTEADDRGEKWDEYRQIETLQDYLLVWQRKVQVEQYQRRGDLWVYKVYPAGDTIYLSDKTPLKVDALYDRSFEVPHD